MALAAANQAMLLAAQSNSRDTDQVIGAINRLADRPEWRLTEDGLRLYTRWDGQVTEHVNAYYRRMG